MRKKRKVLVVCTGNSARSQMAEGLINHFVGDSWEAESAGTQPSGYVQPLAIQAMTELGIDISQQRSKSTEEFRDTDFDLVITVCDDAAQNCPTWMGGGKQVHIGFPDPAAVQGTQAQKLVRFCEIRDAIREEILGYLERWDPDAAVAPGFVASIR